MSMTVVKAQPVDTALRTLSSDDARRVTALVQGLEYWDSDEGLRKLAHRLEAPGEVYVLTTSTDWRIFFEVNSSDNRITILDIARKATILASGSVAE